MHLEGIRAHWQNWATQYGTDLRATTKGSTAKLMELDALGRTMLDISLELGGALRVLEAGCGNGKNCLTLVEQLPEAVFTGFDFIPEMIEAADELKAQMGKHAARLNFHVGNVLQMDLPKQAFDVVFTDRCLINLNTPELQHQAIAGLADRLKSGGYLLMIENSQQTYGMQNRAREAVGLPARTPDAFNLFFDEAKLLPFLPTAGLELVDTEDFISLHDLVLYVLVPMVNGGKVDYAHPMVAAATQLNVALSGLSRNSAGGWGQNRLYKCRKVRG